MTPHLLDLTELFRKWVLRHDDNFMAKQCVAREVYVIQLSTELLYREPESPRANDKRLHNKVDAGCVDFQRTDDMRYQQT